jgi:OmpA-OmpF porin, OOP family
VGTLPFTENLSMLGRVGGTYARSRASFSGSTPVVDANPSKREGSVKAGLGLQYAFGPSFLMRSELERYRVSNAVGSRGNVDVLSVSLVFPFGRSAAPARQAMRNEPRAVAEAPPPAPVAAPEIVVAQAADAAAVPERRSVSYSTESLFAFDASAVQPGGMQQLDVFVRELGDTRWEVVTVEGHADRLGSGLYNQSLSQRRADAVKDYLVVEGKLDPMKISAVGRSEASPVTGPDDCVGSKPTARLVACLQPDRRVEVSTTGTR